MALQKFSLKILFVFAFFLYPVVLGNIALACYAFIYGIPCLYILLNQEKAVRYLRHFPFSMFIIVVSLLFFLSASLSLPVIYGTYDLTYVDVIIAIFRKLIIYIFLCLVIFKQYKDGLTIERFMFYHIVATVLYVIGTIAFLLLPDLRFTWTTILQLSGRQADLIEEINYITRFGWSGFSGFRTTISCSLSIIFATYLYASKDCSLSLSAKWYSLFLMLCFIGNMFYGRSGVVVSFLCALSGLIMYRKFSLKFLVGSCITVVLLVVCIFYLKNYSTALENWYFWLTIPFENLMSTGSFQNASVESLQKMIFMPDIDTFFFGDARYVDVTNGSYYMGTDSGFMRLILFWGIFLTLAMYLLWGVLLFNIKRDVVFKLMLLLMYVIFEIKGECYYHSLPLFIVFYAVDTFNYSHSYILSNH